MNLLNFIDCIDLDEMGNNFDCIDLHTRKKEKALHQCLKFFKAYEVVADDCYFYTNSSSFNYKAGYCYKLSKAKDGAGTYFLILQNANNYFEI